MAERYVFRWDWSSIHLSCHALIVFVITTRIPSRTLQKGLKMCFLSQNLDLDILFREEMPLSSVLTWTKYIIVCALVFDAFISNMPYWHEPPIWTVAVYREEVRRGVGGSWGLYTLSRSLSSSTPASQQLPAIFHSWDKSKLKMWKGLGVVSLFSIILISNTHTHTNRHPWLPHTHPPHSPTPATSYPTPPTCSCWIIDVAITLKGECAQDGFFRRPSREEGKTFKWYIFTLLRMTPTHAPTLFQSSGYSIKFDVWLFCVIHFYDNYKSNIIHGHVSQVGKCMQQNKLIRD